jgi:hypothetical protein
MRKNRRRPNVFRRLFRIGISLGTIYAFVIRPWHQHWGATKAEVLAAMPGDEWVPRPESTATHAITIEAPAEEIWQWLVQIGYHRAGWYAYDWLEGLAGVAEFADGQSAQRIIPEFQDLKVGDVIKTDPAGGMTVVDLEPARKLVMRARITVKGEHLDLDAPVTPGTFDTSWVWCLIPITENSTRLVVRFRNFYQPSLITNLFAYLLLEPGHFVMEQKMMRGIKDRAEYR